MFKDTEDDDGRKLKTISHMTLWVKSNMIGHDGNFLPCKDLLTITLQTVHH